MNAKFIRHFAPAFLLLAVALTLLLPPVIKAPLRMWDEARLANNALEMTLSGDWVVTHYNGQPDMWNTKPPLLTWLQALSMRLFGYAEWAFRLPTTLAALAAVLMLFWMGLRLSRPYLEFFAGLVLLTTSGFLTEHVALSGDYEAMLIFWMSAGLFCFYLYSEASEDRRKDCYLWLCAGSVTGGMLTKGVAGAMFLPAMVVYLAVNRQLRGTLRRPSFLLAALMASVVVLGFYFLREAYNPGYLRAVWENELGGRYAATLDQHKADWKFYFSEIFRYKFAGWMVFLPLGACLYFRRQETRRNFFALLFFATVTYVAVISFSQTKLGWYDAPVFPLLAFWVALPLERLFLGLTQQFVSTKRFGRLILLAAFMVAIFSRPLYQKLRYLARLDPEKVSQWSDPAELAYGPFMKTLPPESNFHLVYHYYNSHAEYYRKVYNARGGQAGVRAPEELMSGDTILYCGPEVSRWIDSLAAYRVLKSDEYCRLALIDSILVR